MSPGTQSRDARRTSALARHLQLESSATRLAARFLATHGDLLPWDSLLDFIKVEDRAPAMPWKQVREILEQELGAARLGLLKSIREEPLAASFATQTHLAQLSGGDQVEIEVLRPSLAGAAVRELRAALPRLMKESGFEEAISKRKLAADLEEWFHGETDLTRELTDLERLGSKKDIAPSGIYPQPLADLCGPRVLTRQHLPGPRLSTLLQEGPVSWGDGRSAADAAGDLAEDLVQGLFRRGFYNLCLHPDQLVLLPNGCIGYTRFRASVALDPPERRRQLDLLWRVYAGDLEGVAGQLDRLLVPSEGSDVERFRREWLSSARDYANLIADEPMTAGPTMPARWLIALLRVARLHGMWLPEASSAIYRHLLLLEALSRCLAPASNPEERVREVLGAERQRQLGDVLDNDSLREALLGAAGLLRDSPADLHQLLTRLADGSFRLQAHVVEAPRLVQERARNTRLLTTAVLTVAVAVLLTIPDLPGLFGVPLRWVLAAFLGVLFIAAGIQWRTLG